MFVDDIITPMCSSGPCLICKSDEMEQPLSLQRCNVVIAIVKIVSASGLVSTIIDVQNVEL